MQYELIAADYDSRPLWPSKPRLSDSKTSNSDQTPISEIFFRDCVDSAPTLLFGGSKVRSCSLTLGLPLLLLRGKGTRDAASQRCYLLWYHVRFLIHYGLSSASTLCLSQIRTDLTASLLSEVVINNGAIINIHRIRARATFIIVPRERPCNRHRILFSTY